MKLSAPVKRGFERLEPYAGKLARTVLRGGWCSNALSLPDSGDTSPSPQDIDLTHKLQEILKVVDVRVLDHIVVGDTTVSFSDMGLMK